MMVQNGRYIDLLNPKPSDVTLDEIAHNLSWINRFGGHLEVGYSVAQHSCMVHDYLVGQRPYGTPGWIMLCATGLMHDATEAVLGDVATPIKHLIPAYRDMENAWWNSIASRFGLFLSIPVQVHTADRLALISEGVHLLDAKVRDWFPNLTQIALDEFPYCGPWSAQRAEQEFLSRARDHELDIR